MILQLESEGEEVALFTIFDTWVLENSQIRSLWAVNYYLQRFQNLRALPLNKQLATVRRVFGRVSSPANTHPKTGWSGTYWPGEDFRPPQLRAPVLLFKRPRQPYFYIRDPQMGWGSRSSGGVETFEIRCGHVEMLREPYVRLVGQTLGQRLQAIRQQGKAPWADSNSRADRRNNRDPETWAGSAA